LILTIPSLHYSNTPDETFHHCNSPKEYAQRQRVFPENPGNPTSNSEAHSLFGGYRYTTSVIGKDGSSVDKGRLSFISWFRYDPLRAGAEVE
jgi:hypothetical protein